MKFTRLIKEQKKKNRLLKLQSLIRLIFYRK